MINKIYLHWTAGRYDQLFNDYHICIDGDGVVHKMADFETKLAHTYQRNSNAIGIAMCCCYGASVTTVAPTMGELAAEQRPEGVSYGASVDKYCQIHWGDYPPTDDQIIGMALCVARICKEYNLEVSEKTVMTHAEVADIDGYGVNGSDPDLRWDLLALPDYYGTGGDVIREFADDILNGGEIYGITLANIKGNI